VRKIDAQTCAVVAFYLLIIAGLILLKIYVAR
jgi:hypothetical protein